ncbi:MAG: N-formylglutamate deformylase [Aliihoeflea sp.]|uniref:N-formylglutamate deformylase n=1 Tax=Aliihoeflea sp. TaxID=2608088 RepID=UPI00403395B2
MKPVSVIQGTSPVILGMPHVGTYVPDAVAVKLNAEGRRLRDTDWHIDRLYDGLLPGASVVKANFHRYVIDANRDPSGVSLYPGQNTTGLVPQTDFDNRPLWATAPDAMESERRLAEWHAPYHAALAAEVARVKAVHGIALVYDCHSIRSHCPFLFEGELPVLNIGTNDGLTCDAKFSRIATEIAGSSGFSWVANGRFKGGWTTRHYGQPETCVHAIQMEIAQSAYLAAEEEPWTFDAAKAAPLRKTLATSLAALEDAAIGGIS